MRDRDAGSAIVPSSPPFVALVAQGVVRLESQLADLQTPTLVLLGTNDKSLSPETGRRYVERLPNCYYVLVYDTGHAIATERPEALFSAVRDFVERRGAFIVERNNTAINP